MQQSEATILIQKGITNEFPQNWIDLGCGNGTFTLSLANLLPPESHITAIDKTSQHLPHSINGITIDFRKADFIDEPIGVSPLDGSSWQTHYILWPTKQN